MGANLYFMSGDRAVGMSEHRYDSEDILQKIIADNPGLLLRDADPEGSRLMLVAREFEVSEGDDSSNAYFLDHLLVDQSGVPVLVEVKRSTDTRARREVVAQMLDYASRVSAWDADELRELFRHHNDEPGTLEAYDTDEFWMQVANCLKAERVKLVFAADRIPSTLKTLIEFMDRNMEGIEVYGVELRQYKTEEATMLTSSVVGETPLKAKRTPARNVEWNAANFSAFLLAEGRQDAIPVADALKSYATSIGLVCEHRRGTKFPTFFARAGEVRLFTVSFWRKSDRPLCTFDMCVPDVANYLGGRWTEAAIRELLTDMPGRAQHYAQKLIWDSPQYLYIDLRALAGDEDMASFQEAIRKLAEAAAERQREGIVYNIQQEVTPPPPNLALLTKCTNKEVKGDRRGRYASAVFFALQPTIS